MKDLMKPKMREHFANGKPGPTARPSGGKHNRFKSLKHGLRKAVSQHKGSEDGTLLPSVVDVGKGSGEQAFKRPVLVGTFHKTGTFLMQAILKEICHHAGLGFWNMGRCPSPNENWTVGFHWWSDFGERGLTPSAYPTVLIVRDPRNVLVSYMKFHCVGKEHWLHVPDETLGGKTYQQTLLDLPSDEDRLLFEIEHQGGATIADMLAAKRDPAHARSMFVHLETLMSDRSLGAYSEMFRHLGLTNCYMPLALSVAYKHSVFNPAFAKSRHITTGRSSVWKSALSDGVLQEMERKFPDAVTKLGHE